MNFLPHAGPKIRVCSFRQNHAGLVQGFHSSIAKGHVISPKSPPFRLSVRLRNRLLKNTAAKANDGVENEPTLPAVHVKPPKQNSPPSAKSKAKASVPRVKTPTTSPRHQTPIPYTRRIEGLIQPGTHPILQGHCSSACWRVRLKLSPDLPPPSSHRPIAKLAHGLDRVLFKYVVFIDHSWCILILSSPGVHWLKDPRSQVYNFAPRLELIPNVSDFAFERIAPFVKSSHDEVRT
jgi:hypothetical protein